MKSGAWQALGARIWRPVGFGIQDPVGAGVWQEIMIHQNPDRVEAEITGSWDLVGAEVWQDQSLAGSGIQWELGSGRICSLEEFASRIQWELWPVGSWAAGRARPRGDSAVPHSACAGEGPSQRPAPGQLSRGQQPLHQPQGQCHLRLRRWLRLQLRLGARRAAEQEEAAHGGQLGPSAAPRPAAGLAPSAPRSSWTAASQPSPAPSLLPRRRPRGELARPSRKTWGGQGDSPANSPPLVTPLPFPPGFIGAFLFIPGDQCSPERGGARQPPLKKEQALGGEISLFIFSVCNSTCPSRRSTEPGLGAPSPLLPSLDPSQPPWHFPNSSDPSLTRRCPFFPPF